MGEGDPGQLNVLVIDDDAGLRQLLTDILAREEHQVIPVDSAEEGLKLLPSWTFHVAFLDHNLPGMEGLVFGEFLRRNNPDMSIALVTGEEDKSLERRSRDLAISFVPKPFDPSDIMQVVSDYLANAKQRQQERLKQTDPDFAPPIDEFIGELEPAFAIPGVPSRIEDRVVSGIKRALNELRSVSRYTERDRVLAFSGLVTARVLGLSLPRLPSGRTLYEEYDEIMRSHGRREEFSPAGPPSRR